MNDRLGGGRLAGVIVLLLVQAALAAFLGFVVTGNLEEARINGQYLQTPYEPSEKAVLRVRLEWLGAFASAALAGAIALTVLWTLVKLKSPADVRLAHRKLGWLCLAVALGMFAAGVMTPRVGSPHNDMLPGVLQYATALFAALAGGAAAGEAKLAKVAVANSPESAVRQTSDR